MHFLEHFSCGGIHPSAADQSGEEKAKEEELRRRRAGYEELREVLNIERDRVLKNVIPKRFTLRGEAQVYPISVEVRFREEKP